MTCENFREQLNLLLDRNSVQSLSEEMRNHISTCDNCAEYRTSLLSIHEQLLAIPRELPSRTLIHQLKSIGQTIESLTVQSSWKHDALRALMLLSPAILMVITNYLPVIPASIINTVILIGGLVLLLTKLFTPIFFTRS